MGFISSLVTCIPYKYWARSHNHHHAHQGQLDTRTIGDVTLLTVKEYQELTSWKIEIQNLSFCPVMFIIQFTTFLFTTEFLLSNLKVGIKSVNIWF
jgi:omega-6 fatty acid desaturase (delta-12 desaturase)